jgi:hypothetical protein
MSILVGIILSYFLLLTEPFVLEKTIPTDAQDIKVDELGNLYLLNDTYIVRINAVGNTQFRSSELNYGNIEFFDITNPLKPFIYYREIGKLVIFDNTLSQQGNDIDLYERGYTQVELVCGSRGDAYWMWDARNSEMIRVDAHFKKLVSSGNLSVLLGKELMPIQIIERGDHLYLIDAELGIFIFDIYGTYQTNVAIIPEHEIQIVKNELVYTQGTTLHILGSDLMNEQKLEIPVKDAERVYYFNNRLFCLSKGKVEVWKYTETTRN